MARILIVDDAPVMRKLIVALVSDEGHQGVGEGEDREQAVTLYLATRPDVPLIDLMMPRKDGVQATRETLERDRNARVIVVSSSVAQAEVDRDSSGAEQAERACGRGQGRILCGKGNAQALRKFEIRGIVSR